MSIEIAELVKTVDVYELAEKTLRNIALENEEKELVSELDAHFREVGKRGCDPNHEIAAFIQKVVNEEIYNTPDELLDSMFERGTIGEFDDFDTYKDPKNTLIAYEAAKGGNVKRSFLDIDVMNPTWKNRQIETDLSYADVSRNGWKSVALLTDYATAAMKNTMFKDIFDALDTGIASGADNYITDSTAKPTQTSMDKLALYINDRANGDGQIVALSKYIQAASKLTGFVSQDMMNEVHRTGRLGTYDGVSMTPISSAKKLGNGNLMLPDYCMFGVAGKIGALNMKGDVKIYQDMDNNKEKIHLLFKDFTYGYAFNDTALENVCKMALAQS